jgi:hypothetical protein
MTLIGNAIKAAKQSIKAAPKAKPFYSAVDKAALELARTKGTGKEFMTELKKTKGVKPAEIEHRKLEQVEQLPKMTKEQFLAELEKRPPAEVSENVLEPRTKKLKDDIAEELYPGRYDYTTYRDLDTDQQQRVNDVMATRTTAYGDYQIPGGQNYREILLQLPHFMDEERLMYLDAKKRHGGLHPALAREYEQLKEQKASFNPEYLSPHWEGNPNVLAHMRVSDRTTPEGKKLLHVEEVQSDWHQEGREKRNKRVKEVMAQQGISKQEAEKLVPENYGYGPRFEKSVEAYYETKDGQRIPIGFGKTKEEAEANIDVGWKNLVDIKYETTERKVGEGVPDSPFKKNWHELAMKRLINYASENGYDGIVITPGAEQAERYKMSSHIDNMTIGDEHAGLRQISWIPKGGRAEQALKFDKEGNVKQSMISELHGKNISDIFGKDLAEKIVQSKPYERIEGVDLDVGGKGMAGFYDKMVPDYLNQFGKPYGAQVELGGYKLMGDPSMRGEASERLGLAGERFDQMTPEQIEAFNAKLDEANAKNLHYFPITPQMREEVTSKGLPLYQQIGIPLGAGSAGTQIEVPQPTEQPEEPAFASGGAAYNTNPDMSDGGQIIQGDSFKRGGKVHIADNPDTMFMELHDKKLAGGGLLKKALQAAKPAIKGMQEVLPIAEREANLKKFLAPSAEKRRMYHGSKEPNIKEFKTRKEMTDEYNMTGHYADERDAVFLSPEPQFTKHFSQEGYTDTHQAPTTYPVYVQIEKPFDFDNPEHLEKVKKTYLDMYHNPESDLYDPYMLPSERSMAIHTFNKRVDNLPNDENNWARIENKDFQEVLKDLGFDSFYTRERGTKNLGVYEPNRIKSAIGNLGTYDINEPDINKRIGGLTHITRK